MEMAQDDDEQKTFLLDLPDEVLLRILAHLSADNCLELIRSVQCTPCVQAAVQAKP